MEMEKKLEIKHRMRRHEILKNKKKQLYLAKKAAEEVKNMKPMPEIKVSETAQKVLNSIKKLKNKRLLEKLSNKLDHSALKGKTRYDVLKEMKNKIKKDEIEKKKEEQHKFFLKLQKERINKRKKTENNFGLLRF